MKKAISAPTKYPIATTAAFPTSLLKRTSARLNRLPLARIRACSDQLLMRLRGASAHDARADRGPRWKRPSWQSIRVRQDIQVRHLRTASNEQQPCAPSLRAWIDTKPSSLARTSSHRLLLDRPQWHYNSWLFGCTRVV